MGDLKKELKLRKQQIEQFYFASFVIRNFFSKFCEGLFVSNPQIVQQTNVGYP
jgi:hypothetical protein